MSKLTPEIKEYILDNYNDFTYKELSKKINCAYNRSVSVDQIGKLVRKHGLKKTNVSSWFSSNNKPSNHVPIGHEYEASDGYVYIKVCESRQANVRNQPKHKLLWEEHHNMKCPSEDIVIFADGNKRNFKIDNLVKVSRKNLAYLNKHKLYGYNKELVETGKLLSELEYTINRI